MQTNISNRYTDTLYVELPAKQTRNEVGDLVETEPAQLVKWGLCREVPNGGNKVLTEANGTILAYESEVYLHPLTPSVPDNTCIKVFNLAGEEVLHGVAKRSKRYKHYAKIWV